MLLRQIQRTRVSFVINTIVINTDRLVILDLWLRVASEVGKQTVDCFRDFWPDVNFGSGVPSRRRDVRRAVAHAKRSKRTITLRDLRVCFNRTFGFFLLSKLEYIFILF
jgi:hypothetical protein